jgi:hypothetical protein
MSHDQSPARVRMVGSGDIAPGRRRHDVAPTIVDAGVAVPPARAPDRSRRPRVTLALLFLMACALAGIAVARRLA